MSSFSLHQPSLVLVPPAPAPIGSDVLEQEARRIASLLKYDLLAAVQYDVAWYQEQLFGPECCSFNDAAMLRLQTMECCRSQMAADLETSRARQTSAMGELLDGLGLVVVIALLIYGSLIVGRNQSDDPIGQCPPPTQATHCTVR